MRLVVLLTVLVAANLAFCLWVAAGSVAMSLVAAAVIVACAGAVLSL
jgi:hypothetical protein